MFLEHALKEAVKAFVTEIEPEIKAIRLEFEELRAAMIDLAKELNDIAELFQRHLTASKIIEDDIICRVRGLEAKFPFLAKTTSEEFQKTFPTTSDSDHEEKIL